MIPPFDRQQIIESLRGYVASLTTEPLANDLASTIGLEKDANGKQALIIESEWKALGDRPAGKDRRHRAATSFDARLHQFRSSYIRVGDTLSAVGDSLVERMLGLQPEV